MLRYLPILIEKEFKQLLKDKSVFLLAFVLPFILVIIYGSAIRMEAKPVKLGIVSYNQSFVERTIVSEFVGSNYYDVTVTPDFTTGSKLLSHNKIKALVIIPKDIDNRLNHQNAQIDIFLDGVESQLASISNNYIQNTINDAFLKISPDAFKEKVKIISRNWFNEANESVWFLMAGQYVSILTLMCIFLGSFVIAREWDRKTIESLAATNVSALEIVLAKVIVYYFIALWSLFIILSFGQVMYHIPIRGHIGLLILSLAIYAFEMICLGVLISAKLKNQFTATQAAVIIGFLPAVMLSGLAFDLRAVEWFIRIIGNIIPPTYEIKAMRIEFLSGGQLHYLIFNIFLQIAWAILFFFMAVRQVKKDSK